MVTVNNSVENFCDEKEKEENKKYPFVCIQKKGVGSKYKSWYTVFYTTQRRIQKKEVIEVDLEKEI